MRQQRMNFRLVTFLLILLFVVLAAYGGYSIFINGGRWTASNVNPRTRVEGRNVIRGNIFDRNNVLLASTVDETRIYQSDLASRMAVVHVVGDMNRNVANGVESMFVNYLLGFETSLAERVVQAIRTDEVRKGDDLILTIDSALSTAIVNMFGKGADTAGKKGAAVVMNYKTGEILALVSLPVFDPMNITEEMKADVNNVQPFWNRATQGLYEPGSTFKIITAAAALQSYDDAPSRSWYCNGALAVMDQEIHDAKMASHGELNLKQAFTVSCNNTFAQIALDIGDAKLRAMAENFGFNDNFLFSDMVVENSAYPTTGRNQVEVAWSGVGQSQVSATPLHMCMVAAAVANKGVMMEPRILSKAVSDNTKGSPVLRTESAPRVYRRALTEEQSSAIGGYMASVVSSGSGTGARVSGLNVRGKTGSAESAIDAEDVTHAWFIGYLEEEDLPYAVSVVVEAGGGGGQVAAPIARQIFEYLKKNYRD